MILKIDKFWLSTASLLYPSTDPERLVSLKQIHDKYRRVFKEEPSRSLEEQLISWKPRRKDKNNPSRGGTRKRYLFRTDDGFVPSSSGRFRLYKDSDFLFNGEDKMGPDCPESMDVPEEFHYLIDWYLAKYQRSSDGPDIEAAHSHAIETFAENTILGSRLPTTEKMSLLKSRRGQGIFRRRVTEVESGCRLTGVSDTRFLVASHIKPWSVSSNAERLDGHNGLLLAPHADHLFDAGFITFAQDGRVAVSPEAEAVYRQWGLAEATSNPLTPQQEVYMRYHRTHIFRERS